jgi:alkylation response protein AidB-like acyl-CoA dehydrogenase
MEVFAKYGTQAQKDKWLKPLLNGEIRSAFLMTEPQIAASDATNIEMSMRKEGNEWVLNGQVRLLTSISFGLDDLFRTLTLVSHCRNGGLPVQATNVARSTL